MKINTFLLLVGLSSSVAMANANIQAVDSTQLESKNTSSGNRDNFIYPSPQTAANPAITRTKFHQYQQGQSDTSFIINNPTLNPSLAAAPSELTIIENTSSAPMEVGHIEMVGKRSDLLLVSPAGIICNSCEFRNVGRVTLASGHLSSDNKEITTTNSAVIVNGSLSTRGADILSIVSSSLAINGPINGFEKVNKKNDGTYEKDANGRLTLGQTSLQVILGNNKVDHDSLEITALNNTPAPKLDINHRIDAQSVYIKSTGDIDVSGSLNQYPVINTKSDIKMVGVANQKSILNLGGISFYSMGNITVGNAKLMSGSEVSIKGNTFTLNPADEFYHESIASDITTIVTGDYTDSAGNTEGMFTNSGLIQSGEIHISTGEFHNKGGELFSNRGVYVISESDIQNTHRGIIFGSDVKLESLAGDVLNGIKLPWQCVPKSALSKYSNSSIHIEEDTVDLGQGAGLVMSEHNRCDAGDVIRYFNKSEREAYIFGLNIAIQGSEVLNSNPHINKFASKEEYREYKEKLPQLTELLASKAISQYEYDQYVKLDDSSKVMISAESSLSIKASNLFSNGSGTVEVMNGDLAIDAKEVKNQRYYIGGESITNRVLWFQPPMEPGTACYIADQKMREYRGPHSSRNLSFLTVRERIYDGWHHMHGDPLEVSDHLELEDALYIFEGEMESLIEGCEDFVKPYHGPNVQVYRSVTEQFLTAISPSPRLLTGAAMTLNADLLENLAGNIEVFGELKGNLKNLNNFGLSLRKKKVEVKITHHVVEVCSRRVFGACFNSKVRRWTTTKERLISQEETEQVPALFYLGQGTLSVQGIPESELPEVESTEQGGGIVHSGNITYGQF